MDSTESKQQGETGESRSPDDPDPPQRRTPTHAIAMSEQRHPAFEVLDRTGRLARPQLDWLAHHASLALSQLGAAGEVRASIIGDEEMAAAHERHCRAHDTTDVITFDLRADPGAPLDTDLLVCLDEAARQADRRGHAAERELLLYVLHGVLHCLGHDDHDEAASRRMHEKEDEVLRAIGVGPTYGDPGGGGQAR